MAAPEKIPMGNLLTAGRPPAAYAEVAPRLRGNFRRSITRVNCPIIETCQLSFLLTILGRLKFFEADFAEHSEE